MGFPKDRSRRYPVPMFIRRAKIRTSERGKVYYSYRLVRSERSGDRVRQHTLLNLGSNFPLERRHWPMLCARTQQLLDRQGELVPLTCPEEVERHAQHIAARFEGELRKLNDGLSRPRTRKRLDHVWQRIGRIKEKSRGAGAHYVIDVIADDSGKKARALTWEASLN